MGKTSIEWTAGDDGTPGSTWNPVRGCSRISPGCGGANHQGGCYAEKIAARFSGPGQPFEGFAVRTAHGGRWTGKMDVAWDMVDQPIRWRKPRRIFANSMSDLFHKDLPREDVAMIYGTAIAAVHLRGHTIQILTKRADHMRELLNDEEFWEIANAEASRLVIEHTDPLNRRKEDARATCRDYGPDEPPPGIWLGVSVEDQERADRRIPDLLATPAAVRFISAEPLLGAIDLHDIPWPSDRPTFPETDDISDGRSALHVVEGTRLDWVIAGGESGPKARPSHPDWFRSLRDQCAAAGVPFFFKQWGEWLPTGGDGDWYDKHPVSLPLRTLRDGTWTDDGDADGEWMAKIGKKRAGALLDGKLHREFPR